MTIQRALICLTTLAVLVSTPVMSAEVTVWFAPASSTVVVGESVAIDIMANFEESAVAWGIDLALDEPAYADWIDTTIGLEWDATDTLDGDGLAGLRFPPGISGDVLLATLTFEGLVEGTTSLLLSSGPEEDEGFLLESGFLATDVQFTPGSLTVIPEPASVALFALTGLMLRRAGARA